MINLKPSASVYNLLKRSKILIKIRFFFNERGFFEVETPYIGKYKKLNKNNNKLFKIKFFDNVKIQDENRFYLINNPDFYMKKLLNEESGPIFQFFHIFKNKKLDQYHNYEFTILKWYRPYFNIYKIMNEVEDLFQYISNYENINKISYQQLFNLYLNIDPFLSNKEKLRKIALKLYPNQIISSNLNYNALLKILFNKIIKTKIKKHKLTFIYHFPKSKINIAEISTEDHRVLDLFHIYFNGIKIANGFRELINYNKHYINFNQQKESKFLKNNIKNKFIDKYLLSEISNRKIDCSNVSLGIDRLIMILLKSNNLKDVIAFFNK